MKRLIYPLLISLIALNIFALPAKATSNDYVVLESIRAVNTTITLEDDFVYELTVSTPSTFAWDPRDSNWDGFLTILLCKDEMLNTESNPKSCDYAGRMSQFRIATINNITQENVGSNTTVTFNVSGKPLANELGNYFVYLVRIPRAKADDPDNYSLFYYYERVDVIDTFFNSTGLTNISYADTSINVVEEILIPEPVVEPVVPTVEPAPPQPAPRVVVSSPSVSSSSPIFAVVQANFYLPALKGDENWRPMKEIKGSFQDWRRLKKNALNGGMNQVTKTNGALITFKSSGDALSLRYMGGKKRGSFSIYVNGKFLDRVNAGKKKKTQLVKTWDGLGKGPHFIDIVAELKPGQSMAINGIQKPRV
jgi:hypothetical protein